MLVQEGNIPELGRGQWDMISANLCVGTGFLGGIDRCGLR